MGAHGLVVCSRPPCVAFAHFLNVKQFATWFFDGLSHNPVLHVSSEQESAMIVVSPSLQDYRMQRELIKSPSVFMLLQHSLTAAWLVWHALLLGCLVSQGFFGRTM